MSDRVSNFGILALRVKATPWLRRSSRRSPLLGSTSVVVGRNKRRRGTSGATTGCFRRIGGTANVTSHCPLRIKVHDAIDLIVALIVDYYGNVRDHYGDGQLAHNWAPGVGSPLMA